MGLKRWLFLCAWCVWPVLLILGLSGCAGEQLSTVQGEFVKLWPYDQAQPIALQAPTK